ncbi:unnamed protein product, partial [marine sediment metagenome]
MRLVKARARKRKQLSAHRNSRSRHRLSRFEQLETRAMLAATPVSADWLFELPDTTSGVTIKDTAVDTAGNLVVLGEFS